ncbi:DUF1028 domain-containing protein [Pseudooceanicola sp. GBMRC 2024]|uniref:DUF1028 domain-containing protein n=1 Tax=Pseudooceanicola albus TaxID=2692189 RepID=A0A6L7G323_9RHOB|nr:DUF1028 domain-containing protein [Pseudooceanicola albus]MXN17800.1 DUF1028 domain-containing protein [Pseudooceanicola albus]
MTYSLAGRCPQTGQIGFAVATSSVAVGARVGEAVPGCVVFSQCRTDPRLHQPGLAAFAAGRDAEGIVGAMVEAATAPHWRQFGALTMTGAAHYTGASCLDHTGGATGTDCLAVGNFLGAAQVLPAMVAGFEAATGALETRLLAGMLAGEAAGSERDPLQSAAVIVVEPDGLKHTDLRIDDSRTPLQDLDQLLQAWLPKAAPYLLRARDPDSAPSSSVVEGNLPA